MTGEPRRQRFNLSDWALRHRSFVWYLMVVALFAGAISYLSLGREEDPDFTIKTMLIQATLPGASLEETRQQVTDRIEKKLLELDALDRTRSVTRPGRVTVYVDLLPTTRGDEIPAIWQDVRNMMADIRSTFPDEFGGFAFNDSFGDVFGNIYAFTSDGFSPREIRDYVERIRSEVQALDNAGRVELVGTRDEVIYLEFSTRRLAALGLDQTTISRELSAQNAIVPSGVVTTNDEHIVVRTGGQFSNLDSLAAFNLRVDGRFFNLTDIATITRGYEDPPRALFRYNGQEAVGLAIGMKKGGNILAFGEELDALMEHVGATLPIGIEMHRVANQPQVVEHAVGHFVQALVEAVAIVMAVSFVSLGLRAGLVVTVTVPLVLAITFVILDYYGITLQRISLGALIIALGLLVDDAMIAIETMISRLEQGDSRESAASFAWTSIAFPMLSGTLVTMAGFIPIGLNDSNAGEYTFSLFVVIVVSLLVSWLVAVLFAPLLGVSFLPAKMAHKHSGPGPVRRVFHRVLRWSIRNYWLTILATVGAFAVSVWGMTLVQQQFFPTSDRPELVVDFTLPQNASITRTRAEMDRFEAHFADNPDVEYWTSYVGESSPRFLLSLDVPTPGPYMGLVVFQTPSIEARDRLKAQVEDIARREFPGTDIFPRYLELGPPVGKPVQYRLSAPDIGALPDRARELAAVMATDDRLTGITLDWSEPVRQVRLRINQDKARQLSISASSIASALNTIFNGSVVTQLRDATYLVDIVGRGQLSDRSEIEALYNLQLWTGAGHPVPLSALATLSFETEQPVVLQENRRPTITVKAAVRTADQPATLVADLAPKIAEFAATLPREMRLELGGAVESSAESQAPIAAVVPMMLIVMATLIMIQMQSFRLGFIVLSVAPLGLIGVVVALLGSGAPMGFVAILGVLALVGILIRNSIILIHEVEVLHRRGLPRWQAVFDASDSRARPILLTAAAASFALIPISRQVFWGPMAYAMMGGIIAGTLITLLFVPALYAAVFRVRETAPAPEAGESAG